MKKFYITFILMIIIISASTACFATQFYDVLGTKYESPTEILYTLGIVDGTSEHVFSANRGVTRAEMAKLVFTVYGLDDLVVYAAPEESKPFKDIKDSEWYYDYVCAAAGMKIINGYSDGTFRPDEKVTYAEAVTMLIRALGYTNLTAKEGESWEVPYIKKMNDIKLAKNLGYFKNSDFATRGDVAIMIWNMLNCETYMIVAERTYGGFVRDNVPGKIIDRYYPNYAIIDDDILEEIYVDKSGEYAIATRKIDYVKVPNAIPLKRIGVKVSGIYNIEENMAVGLSFIYDEDFDDGSTLELEELYNLNGAKKKEYTLGKSKNYAYVYFNSNGKIDRVTYLGSNENILVKEAKITTTTTKKDDADDDDDDDDADADKTEIKSGTILINDEIEIEISEVLINEDGEFMNWSSIREDGVLSMLENDMYVFYDKLKKGTLDAITTNDGDLCLTIDGVLYVCDEKAICKVYGSETLKKATKKNLEEYVGRSVELITSYSGEVMQINLEENYENSSEIIRFGIVLECKEFENDKTERLLRIQTADGKKLMHLSNKIYSNELEVGSLIHFEYSGSRIESLKIFSDGLEISNTKVDMNIENKTYSGSSIGGYGVDEETVIYVIEKEYVVNSDKSIKGYSMHVEDSRGVLENLEKEAVHVVYDEYSNAVAIFIEKELNKYDYKYARVLDVYEEKITEDKKDTKYALKIKVSPFNNVVSEYELVGIATCEPGDLISYTVDEDELTVKERYNAKLLGDKRDYIIESVKNKVAYLTNGEQIDFSKDSFEVNGKKYLFEKYIVVYSKVSKTSGEWKFYSGTIEEPEKLILKAGDRIAIDEIENLIVIYRGYKD